MSNTALSLLALGAAAVILIGGLLWALQIENRAVTADLGNKKTIQVGLILAVLLVLCATAAVVTLDRLGRDCAALTAAYGVAAASNPAPGVNPAPAAEILRAVQTEAASRFHRALLLIVATLGLLVPVLVTSWNSFNKDFLDELRYLERTVAATTTITDPEIVLGETRRGREEFAAIQKMGLALQVPSKALFSLIVLVLVAALFRDTTLVGDGFPDALIALRVASHSFFLAMATLCLVLTLFLVHLYLVQSALGRLRARASKFV